MYVSGIQAIRAQIYRVAWIMQRLLAQLRQDIFIKVQSLPISFFDQNEAGDLMSRLLNDVSVGQSGIWTNDRANVRQLIQPNWYSPSNALN
jgi:ABC-type multidrug transport system fused ATPase/permease subunit